MDSAMLLSRIRELIQAARRELPGASGVERREWVVGVIVSEIDALIVWPDTVAGRVGEAVDGRVIRVLIEGMVHLAYEEWRSHRNARGL